MITKFRLMILVLLLAVLPVTLSLGRSLAQPCAVGGEFVGLEMVSRDARLSITCAYGRNSVNNIVFSGGVQLLILIGEVTNTGTNTIDFYKGDFYLTLNAQKIEVDVTQADNVRNEFGLEIPRDNSMFSSQRFTVASGQTKPILLAYLTNQIPREGTFSFLYNNGSPTDKRVTVENSLLNGLITLRIPDGSITPTPFIITITSEPTATPGILPTSTSTPTPIPTPTPQPTLVIEPPLTGFAPEQFTLSPSDVALSVGEVVLRIHRVYSPATITTGDAINNTQRSPDIGNQHIVFQWSDVLEVA